MAPSAGSANRRCTCDAARWSPDVPEAFALETFTASPQGEDMVSLAPPTRHGSWTTRADAFPSCSLSKALLISRASVAFEPTQLTFQADYPTNTGSSDRFESAVSTTECTDKRVSPTLRFCPLCRRALRRDVQGSVCVEKVI